MRWRHQHLGHVLLVLGARQHQRSHPALVSRFCLGASCKQLLHHICKALLRSKQQRRVALVALRVEGGSGMRWRHEHLGRVLLALGARQHQRSHPVLVSRFCLSASCKQLLHHICKALLRSKQQRMPGAVLAQHLEHCRLLVRVFAVLFTHIHWRFAVL